jgi:hypothetical protein
MTEKEIADILHIMERAPLQNMHEAKAVAMLMEKLRKHFEKPPEQK